MYTVRRRAALASTRVTLATCYAATQDPAVHWHDKHTLFAAKILTHESIPDNVPRTLPTIYDSAVRRQRAVITVIMMIKRRR